ncbi:HEPN domain-containing protein [Elusimicrobiota bacterium]
MSPDYAREWVRKAEADRVAAKRALKDSRKRKDQAEIACFHAQQCVEKYLKALLSWHGYATPKIHDLLALAQTLKKAKYPVTRAEKDLRMLNQYAVEIRYPGSSATPAQAGQAVRAMEKTVHLVSSKIR